MMFLAILSRDTLRNHRILDIKDIKLLIVLTVCFSFLIALYSQCARAYENI